MVSENNLKKGAFQHLNSTMYNRKHEKDECVSSLKARFWISQEEAEKLVQSWLDWLDTDPKPF